MDTSILLEKRHSVSAPLFDRPFALSIGPQRAGTSWIDRYLRARGDVCMPGQVKEVFFFDRNYDRGPGFYKSHFRPQEKHRLIAEIATTSFDMPAVPRRVRDFTGENVRLLCPLRHPITRSYSLYQHYKRFGLVTGTLQESCAQNPHILSSSRYATHLAAWFSVFDKNNFHFIFQEDLETNMQKFVTDLCNALQIPLMMPSAHVQGRYNPCATSPIPALAKSAYDSANWLRRHRMYPVINAAKKLGLKRLILGTERPDIQRQSIPEDDRKWLEDRLFGQVEAMEKITGPLQQWR